MLEMLRHATKQKRILIFCIFRNLIVSLHEETNNIFLNMTPTELRNERLAERMIKQLKRRNMEAFYCATAAEAVKKVSDLFNFWYNMMFAEIMGFSAGHLPSDGFAFIIDTFSNPVYAVLYVIWICAIWFHLTHGFWSAMQTLGVSGKVWFCRWKVIGFIYTTLLMLGFLVVVLAFAFKCAPSLYSFGG